MHPNRVHLRTVTIAPLRINHPASSLSAARLKTTTTTYLSLCPAPIEWRTIMWPHLKRTSEGSRLDKTRNLVLRLRINPSRWRLRRPSECWNLPRRTTRWSARRRWENTLTIPPGCFLGMWFRGSLNLGTRKTIWFCPGLAHSNGRGRFESSAQNHHRTTRLPLKNRWELQVII